MGKNFIIVFPEELRNTTVNLRQDNWTQGPFKAVIIGYWMCKGMTWLLLSLAAVMPVDTSMYIAAVWTFMTAKWGLFLFLYCRMYARILRGHNPPLIGVWWNVEHVFVCLYYVPRCVFVLLNVLLCITYRYHCFVCVSFL
jgi:hypothetical protein